jgi:protein-L-isoaspartate(D-aspartate) O-methyltransferase
VGIEDVYTDRAFPTKHADGRPISSSSQPAIMAIMLEQLALEPGQRVLEVGAGTGYNAALIAQIVGQGGQVVTIDIDEDLVSAARQHLAAAGFDRIHVRCSDGGYGYPEGAPFDRIILTASAWDISRACLSPTAVSCRCAEHSPDRSGSFRWDQLPDRFFWLTASVPSMPMRCVEP